MPPLANHLHYGDCLTYMASLPAQSVNLIVTDPPYLVNYRSRDGRTIIGDNNSEWLNPAFTHMYRILKDNSFALSFYGWNHVDKFMTAWRSAGFRIVGHFVFAKNYASKTGFAEFRHECAYLLAKGNPPAPDYILPDVMPWGKYTGNRLHPTQKPLEILRPLIRSYSQIGDMVFDPFAGSASTLIAAAQLERSWMGCELDPAYYQKASQRLINLSHSQKGASYESHRQSA